MALSLYDLNQNKADTTALSTEMSLRTSADMAASTANSTAISTRTSVDIALSASLSTEVSTRIANSTAASISLSTETSIRTSTDTYLNGLAAANPTATDVSLVTTNFNNNLTTGITNVQLLADAVDDLTVASKRTSFEFMMSGWKF